MLRKFLFKGQRCVQNLFERNQFVVSLLIFCIFIRILCQVASGTKNNLNFHSPCEFTRCSCQHCCLPSAILKQLPNSDIHFSLNIQSVDCFDSDNGRCTEYSGQGLTHFQDDKKPDALLWIMWQQLNCGADLSTFAVGPFLRDHVFVAIDALEALSH